MSIAASRDGDDWEVQRQLDQLMPPPLSALRKLVVGGTLVLAAIGFTVLNFGGYLIPRPFDAASFSSGSSLLVDSELGLVGAQVMIPNVSRRTVRVTAVDWDAPGAELVRTEVIIDADQSGVVTSDGSSEAAATAWPNATDPVALPASIDPGQTAHLVMWFRPLSCADGTTTWGIAEPTFDFGEGAWPPISRTIRVEEDPIRDKEESFGALVDGEWLALPGPLALACEVLR